MFGDVKLSPHNCEVLGLNFTAVDYAKAGTMKRLAYRWQISRALKRNHAPLD